MFLTAEYLAICMEYATDGDMFQLVVRQRGLLEKDARWYFQQLIVAVDYCHRMVGFPPYQAAGARWSSSYRLHDTPTRCKEFSTHPCLSTPPARAGPALLPSMTHNLLLNSLP